MINTLFEDGQVLRDNLFEDQKEALRQYSHKALSVHKRTPKDCLVTAIVEEDPLGGQLVELLMPGQDFQPSGDTEELAVTLGVVGRELLEMVAKVCPEIKSFLDKKPYPSFGNLFALVIGFYGASLYEVPYLSENAEVFGA